MAEPFFDLDSQYSEITVLNFVSDLIDKVQDAFASAESIVMAASAAATDSAENTYAEIDVPIISPPSSEGYVSDSDVGDFVTPEDPGLDFAMVDYDVNISAAPVFHFGAPAISIPDAPDPDYPEFSKDAPAVNPANLPTSPELPLIPVPQLADVQIPTPPAFNEIEFGMNVPAFNGVAPNSALGYSETLYTSQLLGELEKVLLVGLREGGKGLTQEAEQALYDKALSQRQATDEAAYNEALNAFAERGFSLPPGPLYGALLETREKIDREVEAANAEILSQQTALAQQDTHFYLKQALVNEGLLSGAVNEFYNRAQAAARIALDHAITIYAAKLDAYRAMMTGYKLLADVYESTIKREIAKAEIYKAQIEGVKVTVEHRETLVSLYTAQVAAIQPIMDLYSAEMQAAAIQADTEKLKMLGFKSEVEAYAAKVQGITERFKGYQAQVAGEGEKAKVYAASAQAYEAMAQAYKAEAMTAISEAEMEIENNKVLVDAKAVEVARYREQVRSAIGEADLQAQKTGLIAAEYGVSVTRHSADVERVVGLAKLNAEKARTASQKAISKAGDNSQKEIATIRANTEIETSKIRGEGQKAAAEATIVTTSVSYQEGTSTSLSESRSVSRSTSDTRAYSNSVDRTVNYYSEE